MEDDSPCNSSQAQFSNQQKAILLYIYGGVGVISTLCCVFALIVAVRYRFYQDIVQRLVLYQLIAALAVSLICAFDIIFVNYHKNPDVYQPFCAMAAYFNTVSLWTKIGFTFWLSLLLFICLVYLKQPKDVKKLEPLYILTSFGIPMLFSWIPFANDLYGISGAWCWIKNWEGECANKKILLGTIEQYALFYAPATVFFLIDAILITATVIVLLKRIRRNNVSEEQLLLGENRKQKQLLRMILPLSVYPVVSIFLYIFPFSNRVYSIIDDKPIFPLFILHGVTEPLWGCCVGIVVTVHICIAKSKRSSSGDTGMRSVTDHYTLPKDSMSFE
ncbi:PREDICTED: uncharacterized protein LOC105312395 [Amphimedon queenslandica]|uniref:G-protein coupled receptors family 2 profile 2 domain-containing protein n=1 Tax=Amphimedon queenslandica TaxID=400682 RepID=A0A1X7V2F3_AMPQE|nr:PREDICTED: uncharacterized protein LOC105312395 [Amphimedon queenslandica]|eukprot:XP_011403306.1 PREDICTED: uncharacterized protein LOC105312395 [Amphimedon queenslandica]